MPDLNDPALRKAVRLVETLLINAGPAGLPATEVVEAGERQNLTRWQLRNAREVLSVKSEKEHGVRHGKWMWKLQPGHVPMSVPATPPPPSRHHQAQRPIQHPPQRYIEPIIQASGTVNPKSTDPSRIHRVVYQVECHSCGRWTNQAAVRTLELRETQEGSRYAVNGSGTQYGFCDTCRRSQIAVRRKQLAKRIAGLEWTIQVLQASDPNDPNIVGSRMNIDRLREELQRYDKEFPNA